MKEALGRMKNTKEKNMCWQDGRLFDDKEDWVVDSCTKCTCQVVPSHNGNMYRCTVDVSDPDVTLTFMGGRSPRSCATRLHALQWPVPAPHLSTASAAPCVCVSSRISQHFQHINMLINMQSFTHACYFKLMAQRAVKKKKKTIFHTY